MGIYCVKEKMQARNTSLPMPLNCALILLVNEHFLFAYDTVTCIFNATFDFTRNKCNILEKNPCNQLRGI